MSQSPFPVTYYAAARLDWCRASNMSGGGEAAQLVCSDLARQCGSYTNATRDARRIQHTAPLLQDLIRAPEIQRWEGKCPVVEAGGICGLGGAQRFQKGLWQGLAAPRETLIYEAINNRRKHVNAFAAERAAAAADEGEGGEGGEGGEAGMAGGAGGAGGAGEGPHKAAPQQIQLVRDLPGAATFPNRAAAYAQAVQARTPLRSTQNLVGLPFL